MIPAEAAISILRTSSALTVGAVVGSFAAITSYLVGATEGVLVATWPLPLSLDWTIGVLISVLCLLLLAAAVIDARTLRLPDVLTAGVAVCAAALAWRSGHIVSGVVAAALSACLLYGVKLWLERRSGRSMLGLGDIKLIAALALWLGLRTPAMLALAAILGLVAIRRYKGPMPFGPMIAGAAFVVGVLVPEGWLA